MSTDKFSPPPYEFIKSDEDYADTGVKLQKAVDDSIQSAIAVESCFKNVMNCLLKARDTSSTFAPQIQEFCDEWSGYTQTYHDQLRKSGDIGSQAGADAEGFSSDLARIISEPDVPLEEKKGKIQAYQEKLERSRKESEELSQHFVDLQSQIVSFQGKVTTWVEKTDIGELESAILVITGEIEKTEDAITRLREPIRFGIAGGLCCCGISTVSGVGMICCCPCSIFVAMFSGMCTAIAAIFVAIKVWKKRGHQRKLETQKNELKGKKEALDSMSKIQAIVKSLDNDLLSISQRLVMFAEIWGMMHADLVELNKKAELTNKAKGKALFENRITSMKILTKLLSAALRNHDMRPSKLDDSVKSVA